LGKKSPPLFKKRGVLGPPPEIWTPFPKFSGGKYSPRRRDLEVPKREREFFPPPPKIFFKKGLGCGGLLWDFSLLGNPFLKNSSHSTRREFSTLGVSSLKILALDYISLKGTDLLNLLESADALLRVIGERYFYSLQMVEIAKISLERLSMLKSIIL